MPNGFQKYLLMHGARLSLNASQLQKSSACKSLLCQSKDKGWIDTRKYFLNCFRSSCCRARTYSSPAAEGTPSDGKKLVNKYDPNASPFIWKMDFCSPAISAKT